MWPDRSAPRTLCNATQLISARKAT
jgi:hypothetical protein